MVKDSLSIKLERLKLEDSIAKSKKKKEKTRRNNPLTDKQKKEIRLAPIYKKLDSIKRKRSRAK